MKPSKDKATRSPECCRTREVKEKEKQTCTGACDACSERKEAAGGKLLPKVILVSCLLLVSFSSFGQALSDTLSFWNDPFNHPMLPLYLTMVFVGATVLLLIVIILYMTKVLKIIATQNEMDKAAKSGKKHTPGPSWFELVWQKMNAAVPVANEADIDLGHNFDGIRELDNHLPPWWTGLLYLTHIWAVIYMFVYHLTPVFPLQGEEYANELSAAEDQARMLAASRPMAIVDEDALVFTGDEAIISKGKVLFTSNNCGSCHRQDGGGNNIGPNLTDDYWIHGGSIKNVFHTIKEGAVEKGMPAWGKVMSPEDVKSLAFYIMSLRGSNPPDAKKAQGDLYKVDEPLPADSTQVRASLK